MFSHKAVIIQNLLIVLSRRVGIPTSLLFLKAGS
jgi:hypothetical protein